MKWSLFLLACRLITPTVGMLISQRNSAGDLRNLLVSKDVGKHAQSNHCFSKIPRSLLNWTQISWGQGTNQEQRD